VCGEIRFMQGCGRVVDNRVRDNLITGIWLLDPQGVVVEDNRVEENKYRGIEAFGYYLPDSSAKIIRNIVRNNGEYEMQLSDNLRMQVADNLVVGNGSQVAYFNGDDEHEGLAGMVDNNTFVST
jgi:parallel beta-helix repeat protein